MTEQKEVDWAVVQEIHAIRDKGGKLMETDISVSTDGITIRRQYLMPDKGIRVVKNNYKEGETELNADLFMLDCDM